MQLSIIIVNYNVKYFLEQCLYAVQSAVQGIDAEVIVVDNASTDGSVDFLASAFPQVHFISHASNLGFAKANNSALAKAKGELILFLNPDTVVAEDTFKKCIHFLQTHSHTGALGVRMIDGSGTFLPESKRAFPSSAAAFYKLSGLSSLFPASKTFARYNLGYLSEFETHKVDVLSGAFMMIRRDLLLQTGGFDEDFFMYGEDIDLSFRLQQIKDPGGIAYSNYYFNDTTILHYKGESTKKGSYIYVQQFYKAMLLFVKKHPQQFYNGAFTLLMNIAIVLRGMISWAGSFFNSRSKPVANQQEQFWIIGAADAAKKISDIFPSLTIRGASSSVEEALLNKHSTDALLLCEGKELSFKQIINITEQSGGQYNVYLHAYNSKSIVSSSSRNKSGRVIEEHVSSKILLDD